MYEIIIKDKARKRVFKFPKDYQEKIAKAIATLEKDPYINNLNITSLSSLPGKFYRVRLGDIRIIYELLDSTKHIIIINIDFRGNVY